MTASASVSRADELTRFTRRDAVRLAVAAVVLVGTLTAILAADLVPQHLDLEVGRPAPVDIIAPRSATYTSTVLTEEKRQEARAAVAPQYDYSTDRAIAVAAAQLADLQRALVPVDHAFEAATPPEERRATLEQVLPDLPASSRETLQALDPKRWPIIRDEATRVLDATERTELRDSRIAETRAALPGRMSSSLDADERVLAADIIGTFLVPNSSFSQPLTDAERDAQASLVPPQQVQIQKGQIIVREHDLITDANLEAIQQFPGLLETTFDVGRLVGWFLLAALLVVLFLGWVWRFRRDIWHRTNVLVLVSLLLVFTAFALKLTADRLALPFLLPTAALGMLIAILLDTGVATVLAAFIALIAGAVNGLSLEIATYVFFGNLVGIIAVRRGDRLQVFVRAAIAVFLVNATVVATFGLLGNHDLTAVIQLWGASAASAGGAGVAAVGSFAVLGNLFGILTVFQLLELANPSQPLLRRLLVETPGTYHHSIMVGNLAERAAEAIGADTLITRVAAYYHDIGKLANPMAFIENQAGGENIHDQLEPEVSAQVLKQHVVDGIEIAYRAKLPKTLIAFIPQHHGTAIMSYFYARARELAAEPFGGLGTAEGRRAADAVDQRKFRHSGPKPQSREAALIMLADGVEASVRSLASRDEAAIRAMVGRIIDERLADGQFDECDLTLRDIERIREAFVGQLLGMYHTRIAYPQNKVVELESRRGAGTGA